MKLLISDYIESEKLKKTWNVYECKYKYLYTSWALTNYKLRKNENGLKGIKTPNVYPIS